jgi:hypothetical protein
MAYGFPAPPPAKPPISGADLTISITALVLTVVVCGGGALMGVFLLAFLDHCPPETCSIDGAVNAVAAAVLVAGVTAVAGAVLTIVQLIRRAPGWPFAIATLLMCVITLAAGGLGYTAAVGG